MPSYRTILTIGALLPGHAPPDVEAAARDAVGGQTTLEAFQVDVVAGEPRVTIRYTGADDAAARDVHERVRAAVAGVARVRRGLLAKVVSGRSVPVH